MTQNEQKQPKTRQNETKRGKRWHRMTQNKQKRATPKTSQNQPKGVLKRVKTSQMD